MHWVDTDVESYPINDLFGSVTVPDVPPYSQQTITWWQGIAQPPGTGYQILQPILTFGYDDPPANDSYWTIAAYYIDSSNNVYYYGSELEDFDVVKPGDNLDMEIFITYDQNNGQYAYQAQISDTTQGYWWYLYVDTNFNDNPFTYAYLATLEVAGFQNCNQLTSSSLLETPFSYVSLYTTSSEVPPADWIAVQAPAIPECANALPYCDWDAYIYTGSPVTVEMWGY